MAKDDLAFRIANAVITHMHRSSHWDVQSVRRAVKRTLDFDPAIFSTEKAMERMRERCANECEILGDRLDKAGGIFADHLRGLSLDVTAIHPVTPTSAPKEK